MHIQSSARAAFDAVNLISEFASSCQEQLEADLERTWARDPIILGETKGTPDTRRIGGRQLIERKRFILVPGVGIEPTLPLPGKGF
jgi:hypothetical protein